MSEILCLSEFQPTEENMIKVDSIENIDLFNNHYSIAYRDASGNYRHARKPKTNYIARQIQQYRIHVNEVY